MVLFSRSDGDPVEGLSLLRRSLPFVMPGRNESAVYYEQEVDVTGTLKFVEKANQGREGNPLTFFHVFLAGGVRTLALRPRLNRFVAGHTVYQRKRIEISFAVKKAFTDRAALTTVKIPFEHQDTLEDVAGRVDRAIGVGRAQKLTSSEKEMKLAAYLPTPMLAGLLRLQRVLDRHNLLPGPMIENDPLYASLFVANVGSIGLEAPFHHLYEYGTVSLFAALGCIRKVERGSGRGRKQREVVTIRYSFDERIADGFYCARSLELFKEFVENPAPLQKPPDEGEVVV